MADSLPTVVDTIELLVNNFPNLTDDELVLMSIEISSMQRALAAEVLKRRVSSASSSSSIAMSLSPGPAAPAEPAAAPAEPAEPAEPVAATNLLRGYHTWTYQEGQGHKVYDDHGNDITLAVMALPKKVCAGEDSHGWLRFRTQLNDGSLFWA